MDNMEVTWMPAFGPEQRGGTANVTVIVSDERISSPILSKYDIAVVLNQPSLEKFESGSSQCTSPKHPVSCIKPGLAICFLYDIIHVSMPFSQIIPHLPLPQSPKDCSIHLCLFCCLAYRVIVTIFLNSIYIRRKSLLLELTDVFFLVVGGFLQLE